MPEFSRSLARRPLGSLALAAGAGVLFAEWLPAATFWPLQLISIGVGVHAWKRQGIGTLLAIGFLTFATLHLLALRETRLHPLHLALIQKDGSQHVIAEGRIEKPLRRDLPGAQPGAAWFHATDLYLSNQDTHYRGLSRIKLFTAKETMLPPGVYRIEGNLKAASVSDNPGQFEKRDFELRHGLLAELTAVKLECLQQDHWNLSKSLTTAAENCREWIKKTLEQELENDEQERTLILAMVLGSTEASSMEMEKPFRQTGTVHIFAVSGLHVGIVAAIFWMLLKPFGASRSVMLAIIIPSLFAYAFITGLRPSTIRAAVTASVFLCGALLQRRSDLLNSLGAAALIIFGFDTQQLFSAGFQLSFLVIAAIGLLTPLFTKPFLPWIQPDPFIPISLLTTQQNQWSSFRGWLVGLFAVSAAATTGSLPLMIGHFAIATPISIIANMALVPLSFLVLFTAVLRLICGLLHLGYFQSLLGNADWALAKLAFLSASFFAAFPGAYFNVPTTDVFHAKPPAELTILRLPGGGAAQHLRVGKGDWLLDDGSKRDFPYLLHPYLAHRGVNELDGVFLSHTDSEHIGGTLPVLQELPIGTLYEPTQETKRNTTSYRFLKAQGLAPRGLGTGNVIKFPSPNDLLYQATVLYPPATSTVRQSNDRSLIMRFDLGKFRLLWCNDAGFITEKTLLETCRPEDLQCDILVRNHHPTDYSMLAEFLSAVQPRVIVSSNDPTFADEKLPDRLRLECQSRHIRLMDQKVTGAVTLRFWPDNVEFSTFHPTEGFRLNLEPKQSTTSSDDP
jgi:ComEC/Rec2-related protein